MRLPPQLLARALDVRRGVEVGAGAQFGLALALAEAAPEGEWWVTDVDGRVLGAPAPLRAAILDLHDPGAGWDDVDLVYAIRLPEELQGAAARFARAIGADLALRPLKDEWADLTPWFRRHVAWPEGWRFFPIESAAGSA